MAINDALLTVDCVGGQETNRTNGDRLAVGTELHREWLRRQIRRANAA